VTLEELDAIIPKNIPVWNVHGLRHVATLAVAAHVKDDGVDAKRFKKRAISKRIKSIRMEENETDRFRCFAEMDGGECAVAERI
jgi:hypothetical protein